MGIFLSIQAQNKHFLSTGTELYSNLLIQQSLWAFTTQKGAGDYPSPSWLGCFGGKKANLSPANRDILGAPGTSLACIWVSDTHRTGEAGEEI